MEEDGQGSGDQAGCAIPPGVFNPEGHPQPKKKSVECFWAELVEQSSDFCGVKKSCSICMDTRDHGGEEGKKALGALGWALVHGRDSVTHFPAPNSQ